MSSNAITHLHKYIEELKSLRDRYDLDDNDIIYFRLHPENIIEYNRRYDILCILLSEARNYLWNISPTYRDHYNGEFDTVMAVF
jgi:hypothetical protein